jgi:hypothetical protein
MHRRARFVWTPRQPIDDAGLLRAFLGGRQHRDDGTNRWLLFRREIELPARPRAARLRVFADSRYQLFVNGTRVARGPVRASPHFARVDEWDVAPRLRRGPNALGLLVHVYGVDLPWYETAKGHWQPVFGDGGVYLEGEVQAGTRSLAIRSDSSWRCIECDAWERDAPREHWGPFVEVFDARRMPEGWCEPGFDDARWDAARELVSGGGPPDAAFGGMRTEPFPTLLPREIPALVEAPVAPARLAWVGGLRPDLGLPAERRALAEPLCELPAGLVERPRALLTPGPASTRVRTRAARDVAFLLDFGRIVTGYPFVEIDAEGGETVELHAAEGVPNEWDERPPAPPRVAEARGVQPRGCRFVARAGPQRFERAHWTAVRWLQVTVRNAPRGLRIRHAGVLATHYPAEPRGAFACSDPLLERLWEVGRYTLLCCMHDGFEDCPGREQRQWLGDVGVEFPVSQAAFGPSTNALHRQFLRQAAESQRPDGLTQMFAPGDHGTNLLLIPDWTLQWILCAEQHHLYTGEREVIEEIFPAIERALAWFERQRGPSGLVAECPYWHFHDWAAVGRHGEAATLNALLAGALAAAAGLARAIGRPRVAARLSDRARDVARALSARHWDAARGVYVDCVDPETGARDPRVSQHANAAAILWGVAPRSRHARMIDYVMDPGRALATAAPPIVPSGPPFDPSRHVVAANTFFSHFVYRALAAAGRFDLALAALRSRFGPMIERGATTLWESFEPTASLCHGFSTTPVYQLSTQVLGVAPASPGFERLRIAPVPVDLAHAHGVFPTVRGDVRVAWERRARRFDLEVDVPDGARAAITPPPGFRAAGRLSPVRGRAHLRFERA